MASVKQLKFYFLLLSGIIVSLIGVYIFFTSSVVTSLFGISTSAFTPNFYSFILDPLSLLPHATSSSNLQNIPVTITNASGQQIIIHAFVANTESEREHGLMGVKSLPLNEGMLFEFPDGNNTEAFWMKNTLIPLDMLFISSSKSVVYIQHNAPPCTADPCAIYSSQYPVQYVLEVQGNLASANDVQIGNSVSF